MECERERPHRTTSNNSNSSNTSELFVCFTSRLSSSSMKLSSKSILSPSRSREPPQISLQSSLSRRLRNNGSIKGGQASPMFPATTAVGGGKRRGCGFDNPEPSSPKVTCIGQVRVKTKKQGKKMRSRSKRRGASGGGGGGEALSFRRSGGAEQNPDLVRQNSQSFQYLQQQECLKHRNQRWVHIPLTICEALREFSCFFPCKSSCISKEEGNKGERSNDENGKEASCGAAFARWLMALQEGDGKGREIELVMREEEEEGGGDSNNNGERSCYSHRRHVLEDIDIGVVEEENKKRYKEFGEVEEEEEEEKGGRVSICVPPKNALLLMRCRSDPVKMAALANRFWESPVHKDQVVVDEEEEEDEDEDENRDNEGEVVEEEEEAKGEEGGGEKEHFEIEENDEEEEERKSFCESEIEGGLVNIEENLVIQLEETEEEEEVKESCEIESKVTNFESNDVLNEPNQDKEVEVNEEGEENNESEGEVEEGSVIIHQGENFSCDSNSTLEVHHHADLENEEIEEVQVVLEPSLKNMEEEQENEGSSKLYPTPSIFIASELQSNESKAESESEANKVSESAAANEGAESEAIVEANEEAVAEGNEEAISVEAESEANGEAIAEAEAEANEEAIAEAESEVAVTMAEPEAEEQEEKVTVTAEILSPEQEVDLTHGEPEPGQENGSGKEEKEGLPECLLLMMCEPKLSMEVSKETWVCSTDFVRWLPPERFARKTDGAINERRFSLGSKPKRPSPQRFLQPPRSSCSIPAATAAAGLGGLAGMIEQKLVGSKGSNGYEPFVLTRCKSEPVRSSAKLVPLEPCFWKDRKLEPATLGVGPPAGVGF